MPPFIGVLNSGELTRLLASDPLLGVVVRHEVKVSRDISAILVRLDVIRQTADVVALECVVVPVEKFRGVAPFGNRHLAEGAHIFRRNVNRLELNGGDLCIFTLETGDPVVEAYRLWSRAAKAPFAQVAIGNAHS